MEVSGDVSGDRTIERIEVDGEVLRTRGQPTCAESAAQATTVKTEVIIDDPTVRSRYIEQTVGTIISE